jgi:hypothetical protein
VRLSAYDIQVLAAASGARLEGKLTYGPYLLISREKGAGGSAVAQLA